MPQIRAFFHNKKAATVFDSRCASKIALLAVVLLLSAYHGCTNNSAAAYEQNRKAGLLLSPVCGEDVLPGLAGRSAEPFPEPFAGISTAAFL